MRKNRGFTAFGLLVASVGLLLPVYMTTYSIVKVIRADKDLRVWQYWNWFQRDMLDIEWMRFAIIWLMGIFGLAYGITRLREKPWRSAVASLTLVSGLLVLTVPVALIHGLVYFYIFPEEIGENGLGALLTDGLWRVGLITIALSQIILFAHSFFTPKKPLRFVKLN